MSEQDEQDLGELIADFYHTATDPFDAAHAILAWVADRGYRKHPEPEWEYGTALVGASGEIWDEEPSESLEAALEVVAGSNSESTQYPDESPCVVVRRSKWERIEEEQG